MFNALIPKRRPLAVQVEHLPPGDVAQLPGRLPAFMWFFLRQAGPLLALLLVVQAGLAAVEISVPWLVGSFVDAFTGELAREAKLARIRELVIVAAVVLMMRPVLLFVSLPAHFMNFVARFAQMVRRQCHRYVLGHGVRYFQDDHAGRIATKIAQTGDDLRDLAISAISAIWFCLSFLLLALWLVAQANLWLVLPLVAWIAGYIVVLRVTIPRIKGRTGAYADARSRAVGRMVDIYTNIITAKLFARDRAEDDHVRAALRDSADRGEWAQRPVAWTVFALWALNTALLISLMGLSAWLWTLGAVSAGTVAMTLPMANTLSGMSDWIMWELNMAAERVGTIEDGMHTLAVPHEVVDPPGAPRLQLTEGGHVRFEDVRFHHGQRESVLDGVTLDIPAGRKVGLVGRSGAGKSTLVKLLLRFHDVDGGRITIDAQDVRAVSQESLRRHIGMITQEPGLLNRSVADNIRYARPEASEAAVIDAAQRAHADGFIRELCDARGNTGYAAVVGEHGVKLSGGQRQRIALARVILEDAPILVLDEATAALDSEVEAAIQAEMDHLMRGRTVIAIAHRLSTIRHLDRVVVMDRGRLIEDGAHAELLAREGFYARLWRMQTGDRLTADAAPSA